MLFRFIEGDPGESLSLASVTSTETLVSWRFETPGDLEPWTPISLDRRFELSDGHLVTRSSTATSKLHREVDLLAEDLQAVRLSISGGTQGEVLVWWAREGEGISRERHLAIPVQNRRQREFVFDLSAHGNWTGRIKKLWLAPTTIPNQLVRIREVAGLRREIELADLEEASKQPWKVEFGGETRIALLTLPGERHEKELEIPRAAELRLAYGVKRVIGAAPVRFRVRLLLGEREERILLDTVVDDPRDPGLPQWHQATIDLKQFAGRQARLTLEAEQEGGAIRGLALWASPEVVSKGAARKLPANVIVVSLDTLRADHLSSYGYERTTSPHIDAWAKRDGVLFENAVTTAPWTLPSHVSMFTGMDSLRHGVNHVTPAPNSLVTLAELLRQSGYATAAFTGKGFLAAHYGLAQGFDLYSDGGDTSLVARPRKNLDQAISYLRANVNRPFFLFYHTYEVHTPYRARQPYFDELSPELSEHASTLIDLAPGRRELAWIHAGKPSTTSEEKTTLPSELLPLAVAMYDSGIAYADELVGLLLEELRTLGLSERTVVVVTSDHGELIGEHDFYGHQFLAEETLKVPLLFAYPRSVKGGRRLEQQVRTIDIVPTVLELAGLVPPGDLDGRSLKPLLLGTGELPSLEAWSYASLAQLGVSLRIGNDVRYSYNNSIWPGLEGQEELYRLAEDPLEQTNLALSPEDTEVLRRRVFARLAERTVLLLHLDNPAREAFNVSFRGPLIRRDNIKTTAAGCECVTWSASKGLQVVVRSGQSISVEVEDVSGGELLIVGSVGGSEGRSQPEQLQKVSPWQLDGSWKARFTGNEWTRSDAQSKDPSLTIEWRGDPGSTPVGGSTEIDPELRRQLEALGYVG